MATPTNNRPRHRHRPLSESPQILRPGRDPAAQKVAVAAIRGALEKAGLDLAQLDDKRSRGRAELRTALARYRAGADERAPAMREVVSRSLAHWRNSNGIVGADAPSSGVYSLSGHDLGHVQHQFHLSDDRPLRQRGRDHRRPGEW